jgi:phosphatidate cytidylyltransferase
MTSLHWYVLQIYFAFMVIATVLAFARRWLRPHGSGESVWRKYPLYIFINLCFLAAGWLPSSWHGLTILLALLGALASWEIAKSLLPSPMSFAFPLITLTMIGLVDFLPVELWLKVWLAVILVMTAIGTFIRKPVEYPAFAFAAIGCVIYLPVCLAAFLWVHQSDPSGFLAAFLYLAIATNDALAQITGQAFGRRQLTPLVSPGKTVEGALGGLVFASAMGVALSHTVGMTYLAGGMIALVAGFAGLVGDLTASMWKRVLDIKNYSALLGAQGGVMDRFDGLIFAAPVFYLLLTLAF